MTENRTVQDVIYLASCAVNGRVPEKARVDAMDLGEVFALAARHMISSAVAMALESGGCQDRRCHQAIAAAQRKAILFQSAMTSVISGLEAAGIWYMPLKGAVLKDLYPKYGMREFADHDILIDASRVEDVKALMEGLGFKAESYGAGNHDCYYKQPCLNFEMHRGLFGPSHDERVYAYYQHVEERLLGDGCEKHLSPEDFYVYFLAHAHKHYSAGGTGLRSILDTYMLLHRVSLDMGRVEAEVNRLGIGDFEKQNRSLATHLFGGGELTAADRDMLEYILSSGTYGTIAHSVENKMKKNGWGKLRYMLHRFLVPVSRKNREYAIFAGAYPLFYKYKVLLPALPFYRTIRSMWNGRFRSEARAIRKAKIQ